MYKKVMVAIGDDETSQVALQEALNIAAVDGAKLCIVHAVSESINDEGVAMSASKAGRGCWREQSPPPVMRLQWKHVYWRQTANTA